MEFYNNVVLFNRGPLSNWYGGFEGQESPIRAIISEDRAYSNIATFNCAEQYFVALKAELFEDYGAIERVLEEKHPKKQQEIGRGIKNFDNETWVQNRDQVWLQVLLAKFRQNKHLEDVLINTPRFSIIAEDSPDLIYGTGLGQNHSIEKRSDINYWSGQNLMGEYLMEVRKILGNRPRWKHE